ncbi:hypothetical protein ACH49O_40900 [Streptomyces coeruleorubidus]|uniref:hypothetical protein n=1 Tax=Streptomyces coeruleorubidus TaxID=116188 RepID=UPI0033F51C95
MADFGIDPEEAWPAGLHFMREAAAALPPGDPKREEMLARLLRTQAKMPPVVPPEGGVAAEMSHYMRVGDLDRLDMSLKGLQATIQAPGVALFTRTDSTSTSVREAVGRRGLVGMFTSFGSDSTSVTRPR